MVAGLLEIAPRAETCRNRRVIGLELVERTRKSEAAVTKLFGYLLPPEAAPPCFRTESEGVAPPGDKALFLRKSDYLIIFHNGVAVRVVLLNQAQPC